MLRTSTLALVAALVLTPALTGCVVRKSTHESTLADLERARQEQQALEEEMRERLDSAAAEAREREAELADLRDRIERVEAELQRTREARDRAQERFEEARAEVHRLEALLNRRGADYRELEQRLESLRAIEREVRQRNRIYEDVIDRFRSLIDGERLSVSIQRGRMVIELPQDVLFESGRARLSSEGRRTLARVGTVLAELDDRRFQVEGHTDDVPISTERFPSNWELSSARAMSVVHLLIEEGVAPESISGAGYGEHQPVASNEDAEGRRRNRRIEIVMLPNLDVIAETELPG